MEPERIRYQRSRFSASLPVRRYYTAAHHWLERDGDDAWRIGFTRFATRMLGDVVDLDFEIAPETPIRTGQVIGWLEGFKATTDIYAPLPGRFLEANPDLNEEIALINTDPHGRGWLYRARGTPGDDCLDVHGYVAVLDATIDRMLGRRHEST